MMARMHDFFTLSLLQHEPTPGELDTSIARLDSYASQAVAVNSNLLIVPEASMTGYNISTQARDTVAEPIDGKLTAAVATLCRKHNIAISYGFIESFEAQFFNSVLLLNKHGEPISHYRKTHLWGDLDRALFSAGTAFAPIVELDGWKLGQLICYDVEFPETVRHLALQGAELVLVSTALMSPWTQVADLLVPARACESQVYIAYANYCGDENGLKYVGHSCIVGPDATVLAKAATDTVMLTAELNKNDIQAVRTALPYHRDRRPELYDQTVLRH